MDLTLGVVGTSRKENERRVPVHPAHLDRVDPAVRARMVVEHGYGERFGVPDSEIAARVGRMATRDELFADADVVLLPKPVAADWEQLREGQVLWGWPHLVQDAEATQLAIDRRLTVVAWEAMNHWAPDGTFGVHVFHMNNELAGYCSVLHALAARGVTGHYGPHRTAAVIGFGNTARGAVAALQGMGVHEVTVLTQREVAAVAAPVPSVGLRHLERVPGDPSRTRTLLDDGTAVPTAEFLAAHDVVVNCVFQDTDRPLMFADDADLARFRPGAVVVDVSCDAGMGFACARATTFDEPAFEVSGVLYYGVDHSPSYLYDTSSWAISEALLPHLATVLGGPQAWERDDTVRLAVEVREGVVANPKVLSFQRRAADHPHPVHPERG